MPGCPMMMMIDPTYPVLVLYKHMVEAADGDEE